MEKKEIITGRNPVIEYLRGLKDPSGVELHISESAHGRIIDEILGICRSRKVKIIMEKKEYFSSYASSSVHQGVVLFIPGKAKSESPSSILKQIADSKGVIVLLDQITDPHNLGSIIRSAEALGCGAVAITKDNSAAVNDTVVKTSAGATAYIETITVTNISNFLIELKNLGYWIAGTSDHGNISLEKLKDIRPACIIIGNEGKGMRRLTEEKCDYIVSIPLKGKISSLNASVAAGIVIYKIING
ncbi:MAG TPA: 23S rRNA (guanosine(2251)-2'-O)-methyltransferase RlmB [Spirochaetota bacterium]|nr:23S rRNA (guanosine(2251)-2'-O)-methyltransferase RlmB [Spirochaetota bacterium]